MPKSLNQLTSKVNFRVTKGYFALAIRLFIRDRTILLDCLRPSTKNIGPRVIRGATWTFGRVGVSVILTIASTAILARLLTPQDFGLIAMASLVTELAALFGNIGIAAILIQKPRLRRLDLDSAFWASIGVSIGLMLLVAVVSSLAGDFLQAPLVTPILWTMSSMFILEGLAIVQIALLSRLLRFREDFLTQCVVQLVRIGFTISFACFGWGVWSLVFGSIIGRLSGTALVWYIVPYIPRLHFDPKFFRNHVKYGGSVLGSGMLNYLFSNIDYWVVGQRFGTQELGYYQTAFSLPEEIRNRLSAPLQRVLFPAYALLQSDLVAFQKNVLRSLGLLCAVVMPLGIGLVIVADPLIRVLYGEKWLPVIPLLQVLSVGGSIRAIFSLTASIFYATNNAHIALRISMFSLPFVVGGVLTGSLWGSIGVAWAMLLLSFTSIFSSIIAFHLIQLPATTLLNVLRPIMLCCGIMASIVISLSPIIEQYITITSLILCSKFLLGSVSYLFSLMLFNQAVFQEIRVIISNFKFGKPPALPG